ncbi:transcription antitermination factor NusB [Candidatus Peregrinibacteria bacterium]|nr:transcription antitermination factor NusB [Candidatus Peregrinibacteria bacterium]
MASYRHLARIAVMQTLFSYEFRNGAVEPDLKANTKEFAEKLTDTTFAEELLQGVLSHKEEIRKIIGEEAPEWSFERIALVDRVLLEIGTYEILFSKDVPPVVAINEAIEIAKVFGDLNSSKFVNGVLSTIMNKHRPEATNKEGQGQSKTAKSTKSKTKSKSAKSKK